MSKEIFLKVVNQVQREIYIEEMTKELEAAKAKIDIVIKALPLFAKTPKSAKQS